MMAVSDDMLAIKPHADMPDAVKTMLEAMRLFRWAHLSLPV